MPRYFIEFSYHGKNYNGWQAQHNGKGVQEVLGNALSLLLSLPVEPVGAGRTDTGVHAAKMFAHFDVPGPLQITETELVYKLNRFLPEDIGIKKIFPVKEDAHARFDAVKRTYEYRFTTIKDPFLAETAWLIYREPDWKLMESAAALLLNYNEFDAFCKSNASSKTSVCHISRADFTCRDGMVVFTISADRFLRNMVRAIVGTLMEIGYHKITVDDFAKIIESKDRRKAGASAPAQGLFLWDIEY